MKYDAKLWKYKICPKKSAQNAGSNVLNKEVWLRGDECRVRASISVKRRV